MMADAHVNSSKVLIVEDDDSTAELERRALARAGTDSITASKVASALELLEKQSFSAILLDYHLPGGDSWAVVEAAELKRPRIPVVLVTGQGDEIVAAQAIDRGVAAYVKKSGTCWDQLPGVLHRVTRFSAEKERLRVAAAKFRVMAWVAETANNAKTEFLAGMSHEIRAPLSLVIGWTYLLEKTPLSEDQRKCVDNIQLAGRALLGVVNNVLDLSKIEAGALSVENESIDLPELLRDLSQMLTESAHNKGIELIVLPVAEPLYRVKGDAPRLRQILVNLVSNAIKFTEAGHVSVKLSCKKHGADRILMRCEVADTGIGIEPDSLKRLFQPFTQADATMTRRFGGTGLGLSISRSLIHLMGGTMEVASSVAVGSTFSFEIPLEPGPGNDNPESRGHDRALQTRNLVEQHGPPLDGLRALVVDDCEINQEVVRRILETHGAIVTCCSDGAAAVEHVRAHHQHLDVVLIDVHMPTLDGNEATRRIRSELGIKTLPIIGLTGSALLSEQQRSFDAGMNDVISKPFDPGTFLGKVRLLVEQSPACHRGFLD